MRLPRKLLIANRGEIACRIACSARRLGLATVAVYSEADRGGAHVAACDEAVEIGPPPAADSYLNAERILEAACATGADALHPGYGFLSENPDFAEAVEAAGLTWVGPPASAIRAMGLKDNAKRLMEAAGVPVTPGYHGAEQDPALLAERAGEIGYPVLIKAAAGGGGKGMRKVDAPGQFAEGLARARSEAQSAFGNASVLIEKFVETPRHIEVQVFADAHGNIVHLFERDCSAQRRHQKVIEEAPAPGMTDELRAAMTRAAISAAAAVGYRGAGTVEFIVDGGAMAEGRADCFYFMEMNTRLQVEHPVTEAVTGIDLVDWQLRVAAGAPLPCAQGQIPLVGHALEARLYAEDPTQDFLPQTGRVAALAFPEDARVDAGVRAGDTVTPHYDPMIAKIVVHAETRGAAFAALERALASTHVAGLTTNVGFLSLLAECDDMRTGRVDTGLIARNAATLLAVREPEAAELAVAAAALSGQLEAGPLAGWRAWGAARSHMALRVAGTEHSVTLAPDPSGAPNSAFRADTPRGPVSVMVRPRFGALWHVSVDGGPAESWNIHIDPLGVALVSAGRRLRVEQVDPLERTTAGEATGNVVAAPLPGLVQRIGVAPGDRVEAGQTVAIIEAMKMEHSLVAPRAGQVADVLAHAGDSVAEGAVLVRLDEGEAE